MESYDDNSITTDERDEKSSESSGSEEEQSSSTTENSYEEEIDPWTTLINDAASKVREQYEKILQALLIEGYDSPLKEAPQRLDRSFKENFQTTIKRVKKDGRNKVQLFFCCANEKSCQYFQWAPEKDFAKPCDVEDPFVPKFYNSLYRTETLSKTFLIMKTCIVMGFF